MKVRFIEYRVVRYGKVNRYRMINLSAANDLHPVFVTLNNSFPDVFYELFDSWDHIKPFVKNLILYNWKTNARIKDSYDPLNKIELEMDF